MLLLLKMFVSSSFWHNNTKCKRSLLKNTEHVNKTKNFVARNGGQTSKPAKARYELKKMHNRLIEVYSIIE